MTLNILFIVCTILSSHMKSAHSVNYMEKKIFKSN